MIAAIGFIGWIIDQVPAGCKQFGKFHLHAYVWHTCTALALHEIGIIATAVELRKKLDQKDKKILIKTGNLGISIIEIK